MKPFASLTERGQGLRLRELALAALRHYPIEVLRLRLLTNHFNAIFKIDAARGGPYVLRINVSGHRTRLDIQSEMLWLAAIRRDTDITVPGPVPNADGEFVTTVAAEGVPEPRHCAIFGWLDGRKPNRQPALRTIQRLGSTMARLHQHANTFQPAASFTSIRQDTVWTFGDPDDLFDAPGANALSTNQQAMFRAAADRAQQEFDDRYATPEGLRFLHADFHLGNVKLRRGAIQVLDFDDSCWCFPEQDIGIALFYLQHRPDYPALRDAFLSGYASCRPLPGPEDGLIETTRHARGFGVAGFVAQTENPAIRAILPDLLNGMEPELREWLCS